METHRAASHSRDRRHRWLSPVVALLLAVSLSLGTFLPGFTDARADEAEPTATETVAAAQDEPEVTATETATAQPTATETVAPEPTATGTAPPEPTATETPKAPTATVTPKPTATAMPTDGPVELEFVEPDVRADHGGDARFELIVRNGDVSQTIDLATSSTNDWTIELLKEEPGQDETPLTDTDSDGREDLGRVAAGAEERIIVAVAVPEGTLAGTEDTLTVRVPGQPGERANLLVNSTIVIGLGGSVSFGDVNMLGDLDPSIPGLSSIPDADGATYVRTRAVQLTVESNAPWTLSCSITGSTDFTEPDSGMAWRVSGTGDWTAFAAGDPNQTCLTGGAGTTEIELDLRIRVDLGDDAENLTGTIHFSWDN